jgi:hypothetical protein
MVVDAGLDTAGCDGDGWDTAGQASRGTTGRGTTGRGTIGSGTTGNDTAGNDTTGNDTTGNGRGASRAQTLAQDWITLWQSELSALAADPELRETWQTLMALWAGTMTAAVRAMPRVPTPHDHAARSPGSAETPRAAPAPAAPDARDAEIERLARHVAALERRLAELERGGDPPVHPKRRPRRRP